MTGPAMPTTRPSVWRPVGALSVMVIWVLLWTASTLELVEDADSGTWRRLRPRASAPLTISMISVVIESWRARFMIRLSVLISSSALSVADFMARWRKACSDAAALSRAA